MAAKRIISQTSVTNTKSEVSSFKSSFYQMVSSFKPYCATIDNMIVKYGLNDYYITQEGGSETDRYGKALYPFVGGNLDTRLSIIDGIFKQVETDLDDVLEQFVSIEGTSEKIVNRVDELTLLTKLASQYNDLIRTDAPNSSTFSANLNSIRGNIASKVPTLVTGYVEALAETLIEKMNVNPPKLLTSNEIEAIIREKYGNVLTEEQIASLTNSMFRDLNKIVTTAADGREYTITIDEYGNYYINGVKQEATSFDTIAGGFNANFGLSTPNKIIGGKVEAKYGQGITSSVTSSFTKPGFGVNGSVEAFAWQFAQNNVPLIDLGNGQVQLIKDTKVTIGKVYGEATASFSGKPFGSESSGVDATLKFEGGINLAEVKTTVVEYTIPGTNHKFSIGAQANIGASAKAEIEISNIKKGFDIGGTLGLGGNVSGGYSNIAFDMPNNIRDIDF